MTEMAVGVLIGAGFVAAVWWMVADLRSLFRQPPKPTIIVKAGGIYAASADFIEFDVSDATPDA
jgi:large-conductance mechanosensitive channel